MYASKWKKLSRNSKIVIKVTVHRSVRYVKSPLLFRTEPNVFTVPLMASICSRSKDERWAYVSAFMADNDKCDSCSMDMPCEHVSENVYLYFTHVPVPGMGKILRHFGDSTTLHRVPFIELTLNCIPDVCHPVPQKPSSP